MYNRDVSISCVVLEIRLGSLEGFMKKLAEEISQKKKNYLMFMKNEIFSKIKFSFFQCYIKQF